MSKRVFFVGLNRPIESNLNLWAQVKFKFKSIYNYIKAFGVKNKLFLDI